MALALILSALERRGLLVFAGIGHFNHQLRTADADQDERFCADLAARLGVPFDAGRADVAALARDARRSIESTARRARYEWLASSAARLGAGHIATGHTLDDQAETVLMRLIRGAATRGLSGIRAARGPIIRPLIECRRAALRAFLAAEAQPFRDDATNLDCTIPRNRLRHELMPVVERWSAGGVDAIARAARHAAEDEDFLEREAVARAAFIVLPTDGNAVVDVDVEALRGLPPAIVRRVLRLAIERVQAPERSGGATHDGPALTSRHLEALERLLTSTEACRFELPDVTATFERGQLRLAVRGAVAELAPADFNYVLDAPGAVAVPEAGMVISVESTDHSTAAGVEDTEGRRALEWAVEAAAVRWPLTVRNRWPGDRIKPLGAFGRKKVQDLLVDAKIPRSERDRLPVVVDATGQVLWVVGVTPADGFRAVSPQSKVVVFRAKRQ